MADEPMLLIPCVERCGLSVVTKLPLTSLELEHVTAEKNWIVSVMTPPGSPIAVGVLCTDCAKRVYPPEVLAEMQKRRASRLS